MAYTFRVRATDNVSNTSTWVQAEAKTVVVKKYYSVAGQRVAMRSNGVVHYIHGDHLGSTSLTTDASGAVVAAQRYLPYGEVRWVSGTLPTDLTYTGQRSENGLGLMDYRARFYSSHLGRFVSADTIIPDLKNSQDLNRYAYVRNNPIIHVDPTGHQCIGGRCPDGSQADDDIQSAMWFAEQYPYDDALVMAEVTKWLNEHPDYDLFADPTAWIEVNGQIQPRNFYVHYAYVLWRADRGEGELLVRQSSAMSAAISGGKFQAAFKKDGIPWEVVWSESLQWGALCAGTAASSLFLPSGPIDGSEQHHVMNVGRPALELRRRFLSMGVDPDLCVDVPASVHKRGGADMRAWVDWLDQNRNATPAQIYKQAGAFLYEFGYDGHYIVGPAGLVHPWMGGYNARR